LWPRVATWFRERSVTQTEESATVSQDEAEAEADQDQSLQTLDGIGPTYEERFHDAGITTVTQLVAADPVQLADRLGLSESRVTAWIEQARQFGGSSDDSIGSS
jgi:polyhydroxyalkanoate synthase